MNNKFLDLYQQELSYLRKLGKDFSEAHPKVASRLKLSSNGAEDPHVERLIEAFAFLTARIEHKLQDDFPQVTDSLLEQLFPSYLAPIPACSIIQLQPDHLKLKEATTIPAGALIQAENNCTFTTTTSCQVLPLQISGAKFYPMTEHKTKSCLSLEFSCTFPNQKLSEIALKNFSFYLNAPHSQAYALFELLNYYCQGITFVSADNKITHLQTTQIKCKGFSENDSLLPYSAQEQMSFRHISEFFTFPEKFLFFEFDGLESVSKISENSFTINFYFSKQNQNLEKHVQAKYFSLNCVPIVNLFEHTLDPIDFNLHQDEFQIAVNDDIEIYRLLTVTGYFNQKHTVQFQPMFESDQPSYQTARKPAIYGQSYHEQGSDMFIRFALPPSLAMQNGEVVIKALCTNRNLPSHLPFGGDEPKLQFINKRFSSIQKITCLLPFTPTYRRDLLSGHSNQFLSLLNFNFLSLSEPTKSLNALKDMLLAYHFSNKHGSKDFIDGILAISSQPSMQRITSTQGIQAIVRGVAINLKVDAHKYLDSSLLLFGTILNQFFANYVSINSFSQLSITDAQNQLIHQWPAQSGDKPLI